MKMDYASEDYDITNLTMIGLKRVIIAFMYQYQVQNIICEKNVCENRCDNGTDHVSYLQKNYVWADEFVIQAATALLDSRLCLIYPNGNIKKLTWSDRSNSDTYMFYFPKLHFQSVTPTFPKVWNLIPLHDDKSTESNGQSNTDAQTTLTDTNDKEIPKSTTDVNENLINIKEATKDKKSLEKKNEPGFQTSSQPHFSSSKENADKKD